MFLHSFYLNLRSSTTCINFLFLGQFSLPFSVHFLCSFLHIFLSPFVSNQPILRLCSLVSFQSFCRVIFPSLYLHISICLSLTAFYYPLRVLTLFLFHCIRFTYNTFVPFIPITFCLYFSIFDCFHFFFLFVRSFVCLPFHSSPFMCALFLLGWLHYLNTTADLLNYIYCNVPFDSKSRRLLLSEPLSEKTSS